MADKIATWQYICDNKNWYINWNSISNIEYNKCVTYGELKNATKSGYNFTAGELNKLATENSLVWNSSNKSILIVYKELKSTYANSSGIKTPTYGNIIQQNIINIPVNQTSYNVYLNSFSQYIGSIRIKTYKCKFNSNLTDFSGIENKEYTNANIYSSGENINFYDLKSEPETIAEITVGLTLDNNAKVFGWLCGSEKIIAWQYNMQSYGYANVVLMPIHGGSFGLDGFGDGGYSFIELMGDYINGEEEEVEEIAILKEIHSPGDNGTKIVRWKSQNNNILCWSDEYLTYDYDTYIGNTDNITIYTEWDNIQTVSYHSMEDGNNTSNTIRVYKGNLYKMFFIQDAPNDYTYRTFNIKIYIIESISNNRILYINEDVNTKGIYDSGIYVYMFEYIIAGVGNVSNIELYIDNVAINRNITYQDISKNFK